MKKALERIDKDAYPTPRYAIELLIERIDFTKVFSFLEPCKGDGRILEYIPVGIVTNWCEIKQGKDYLKNNFRAPFYNIDLIITNPPFSISEQFLIKSLKEAKTVCYLQRVNWLGSQSRHEFWKKNRPDKLFVLSKRPNFLKELGIIHGTDSTEYGWFIWDKLKIVSGPAIDVL